MFKTDLVPKCKNVLREINGKRHVIAEKVHGKLTFAETMTHISYCGAAFLEGHGIYAMMALVLAIVIVLSHIFSN